VDQVGRKSPTHTIPLWVDPAQSVYFITICCAPRHVNQLCHKQLASFLFETVEYRCQQKTWFAHVFLLMPDHVHTLLSFPLSKTPMRKIISQWKAWATKQFGIHWQRDFFEHRLRDDENRIEKANYILANPVRAGLVKKPEDWEYVWFPKPE
jgi:putative transposase